MQPLFYRFASELKDQNEIWCTVVVEIVNMKIINCKIAERMRAALEIIIHELHESPVWLQATP